MLRGVALTLAAGTHMYITCDTTMSRQFLNQFRQTGFKWVSMLGRFPSPELALDPVSMTDRQWLKLCTLGENRELSWVTAFAEKQLLQKRWEVLARWARENFATTSMMSQWPCFCLDLWKWRWKPVFICVLTCRAISLTLAKLPKSWV